MNLSYEIHILWFMARVGFIIYFSVLLVAGFYFGYVGTTVAQYHHNINYYYANEDSLKNIKLDTTHAVDGVLMGTRFEELVINEHMRLDKRVPVFRELNTKESLIILSLSCGLLGGLIRILYNEVFSRSKTRGAKAYLLPVLSCLAGLLTYFITMYIENKTSSVPEPDYFMYAALVGGIFTKSLFNKIERYADKKPGS